MLAYWYQILYDMIVKALLGNDVERLVGGAWRLESIVICIISSFAGSSGLFNIVSEIYRQRCVFRLLSDCWLSTAVHLCRLPLFRAFASEYRSPKQNRFGSVRVLLIQSLECRLYFRMRFVSRDCGKHCAAPIYWARLSTIFYLLHCDSLKNVAAHLWS